MWEEKDGEGSELTEEEARGMWEEIAELIRIKLDASESVMKLWFTGCSIRRVTKGQIVIMCPRSYKRDILRGRYAGVLKEAVTEYLGFEVEIDLRSHEEGETPEPLKNDVLKSDAKDAAVSSSAASGQAAPAEAEPARRTAGIDYTFASFVVGSSNKFAYAACKAVAKQPAASYNPLFLYGPSGIGKTHLLCATRLEVMQLHPDLKTFYVTGENFKNELVDAIALNRTSEFRSKYRQFDVLMIDDIQFIAGKEATQEEFFHTFNELYQSRKQIILASDRPPREIKTLEERLRTRFEWGMLADIKPPDLELRSAILKSKALRLNLPLSDEVLDYLASNLTDNVRNLESAVNRIRASVDLIGSDVDLDLAKKCVSDLISPPEPSNVTAARILSVVAHHYNVSVDDIRSHRRFQNIMMPRHVSIYLIRELTDMSFLKISKLFTRDHSTILSSYEKVKEEIRKSPALEIEVKEMAEECKER